MRFDRMYVALTAPLASASATATTASGAAPRFVMTQIDAAAIERGELFEKQSTPAKPALAFDCIIFPGGAVWEEQAAISDAAAQALAKYVHAGGGWFGTCAGGALCVPPCPSFHSYPAYARAACFLPLASLFGAVHSTLRCAVLCGVQAFSPHRMGSAVTSRSGD
jgi:putative intracellular protease/amidase